MSIHSYDIEQKPILTSVKGSNSVANFRKKMTLYNPNVDLSNDNAYTIFGIFVSLNIYQNQTLTSIKVRNSVANF